MPKYRIYAMTVAYKVAGEYEAESEAEAMEMLEQDSTADTHFSETIGNDFSLGGNIDFEINEIM